MGLLVKTLATDENYTVLQRENLMILIQMELSEKKKYVSDFFAAFLKSWLNVEYLEKKNMTLTAFAFPKLRTLKTWWDKCLKSPLSEDLSTSDMVKVPKHCWNLHHRPSIKFIDLHQVNWVQKSLSYWDAKS